jgi:hypothetical protein
MMAMGLADAAPFAFAPCHGTDSSFSRLLSYRHVPAVL